MYTIYRIEDEDGLGPYYSNAPGNLFDHYGLNYHADDYHPSISEDLNYGSWGELKSYKCACPSLELLYDWFSGCIDWLKEHFAIVEIQVKAIEMGKSGRQCFFLPDDVISKTILS